MNSPPLKLLLLVFCVTGTEQGVICFRGPGWWLDGFEKVLRIPSTRHNWLAQVVMLPLAKHEGACVSVCLRACARVCVSDWVGGQ